jgi:hypothetical protein
MPTNRNVHVHKSQGNHLGAFASNQHLLTATTEVQQTAEPDWPTFPICLLPDMHPFDRESCLRKVEGKEKKGCNSSRCFSFIKVMLCSRRNACARLRFSWPKTVLCMSSFYAQLYVLQWVFEADYSPQAVI